MRKKDLLIEIGTEELPPKALKRLGEAFVTEMQMGLDNHALEYGAVQWFATPRRLAMIIKKLVPAQDTQDILKRGPTLAAAYDESGKPTKAAEGFAQSCNVNVADLEKLETEKGSWLVYRVRETGKETPDLLPAIINNALMKLPTPKRMRWGDSDVEFVRPVHWVTILFGKDTLSFDVLGIQSGNITFGHRFHHPKKITLTSVTSYAKRLKDKGYVIADFTERKSLIEDLVNQQAAICGGRAVIDPDLLDEVTALVEWPVAVTGNFDKKFLQLPREVLIATMQAHQKYFPVKNNSGEKLINSFVTISNIESSNPEAVKEGNERVILPRLSDAAFFWQRDSKQPLAAYYDGLRDVTYQKQLGSLADRSLRIQKLGVHIASMLNLNVELVDRAAHLAKCDLLTEMVGEFPELQGVMGRYYALQSGEPVEVAHAIDEQYLPRFAGDDLPPSPTGQVLAIADKIDTIIGIFGIGQIPTGDRDPFGLRRSAIGILRIISENKLPLDLKELLETSQGLYPEKTLIRNHEVYGISVSNPLKAELFIIDRAIYFLRELGYSAQEVESVMDIRPRPCEYTERLDAIRGFAELPEAAGLSEADKRIRNIISKSGADQILVNADESLMIEPQEKVLLDTTRRLRSEVDTLIKKGSFNEALNLTAQLHQPVTDFFDHVMVNVDNEKQKNNRFALLHEVANLTNRVANISKLAT